MLGKFESPKIGETIKSKRLGWAETSMSMQEKRNTKTFLIRKGKVNNQFGSKIANEKILKKYDVRLLPVYMSFATKSCEKFM
jgi:hypothetical protein